MQIIIYLDESGDFGFSRKSSHYFVLTALVCNNHTTARKMYHAAKKTLLKKFNHKRKKRKIAELKGSQTSLAIKSYFFAQTEKIKGWELYSIVYDKSFSKKSDNEDHLYIELTKELLKQIDFKDISKVLLIIDKRKNKKIANNFNINLETSMPKKIILNIMHEDSTKNYGLQAVDMFCYGIARKYEKNDTEWHKKFEKFIRGEKQFRAKKMTEPAI